MVEKKGIIIGNGCWSASLKLYANLKGM